MAEFPALPFWTDAYLADTRHLSTLQHGIYLLLMMEAWRRPKCSLPDEDVLLARLAGLPVDQWATEKPTVMAFWKLDKRSKTWTQKRLSKEQVYVREKSVSQRERAAKRWNKAKKEDAGALPDACPQDAPTPTPTPSSNKKDSVAKATGTASVPGADPPDVEKAAETHLWDAGKRFLQSRGVPKAQSGSVIGKWKGAYGTAPVIEALGVAQREPDLVDPIPFIEKILRRRSGTDDHGANTIGGVRMSSPC
jgi:uncharacterized protein YdaU (DUF1376 family)